MRKTNQIWKPKRVVVIFAKLSKEGLTLHGLKMGSKATSAAKEPVFFSSLPELVKHFGNGQAYWIHVQGSGVLTRVVDRSEGYYDDLIVNGDKSEFFFSSYTDGQRSIVSFFRKSAIQVILDQLKEQKAHLFSCSSGPIPEVVNSLEEQLNYLKGEYDIQLQGNKILSLSKNENYQATSASLNSIGKAVYTLFREENTAFRFTALEDLKANALEEYAQQRKFQVLGISSLVLIFLLVFANYFYTNSLNQQIVELEDELALNNGNLTLLDQLKGERARKHQLIENSGFLGNKFMSFYLDKIGNSVPENIDLEELNLFPLEEKLKEKRKVTVQAGRVEVNGFTLNNSILDDWIEKINRFEWVERVELLNYMKVDNRAHFKLLIILTK